jgi:ceramide glucosyltransferase
MSVPSLDVTIGKPGIKAGGFPQVSVIVPVAGVMANLESNLRSLLQQEYPAYAVIFVTQDEHDQAVPVIRRIRNDFAGQMKAQHINAGKAVRCSQKNHNLLQGVLASAPSTDILVFCDSGHYAHPGWLEHLLSPLQISPYVMVSSGYHYVFPETRCICSIGRAICVLALYLVRKIPAFSQPWGGAIAIRGGDFKSLGIAELWSTTVVDDVTLADHLQKKKMKVTIPIDADLQTVIEDCSWQAWESWLIRQWAYLKFLFPGLWFFTGLAGIALTFLVYFCIVVVITGGGGFFSCREVVAAAVFLTAVAIGAGIFRSRHPAPGSVVFWYPAFLAALFMAGWCHCHTWFSDSITWAGITYKVAAGGKVVDVIRPEEAKEAGIQDGK